MCKLEKSLIISFLFVLVLFGCQNKNESKKVEAVSMEQLSKEITDKLPAKTNGTIHPGKSVYDKHCLTCHQADGSGVPGMHPPLGPGSWVEREPAELIAILMKGLSGKIEVNGEEYKSFMPSQAKLSDEEIADVLTYIRINFGNNLSPVTPEMVSKIRNGR